MEFVALAVGGGIAGGIAISWGAKMIYDYVVMTNNIRAVEREGWTHIGTIKFVCIYPIDGGRGMDIDIANFGRYGFQTLPDPNDTSHNKMVHYDRSFVIYDLNFEPFRALLNDPQISLKGDEDEKVSNLWNTLKVVAPTFTLCSAVKDIKYLDKTMRVAVPAEQIKRKVRMAFDSQGDTQYELGFYSQIKRVQFNKQAREVHEVYSEPECHLPNYTSCTMVNTKSIEHLKMETGRKDLSHKNFRPQIVFEGKWPYIEENIRSIKMGKLEFHNVRPCTHDENINMNYEPVTNENSLFCLFAGGDNINEVDPYRYLSGHRPINRTGNSAYRNSRSPVFGINFHFESRMVDEDNIEVVDVRETEDPKFFNIVTGQQVYAKYNLPPNHPDAQDEIAV